MVTLGCVWKIQVGGLKHGLSLSHVEMLHVPMITLLWLLGLGFTLGAVQHNQPVASRRQIPAFKLEAALIHIVDHAQ